MKNPYLRYMKTSQELAFIAQQGADAKSKEAVPPFRAKRKNLPTVYEDFWRRTVKSWKAYRKTRYRPTSVNVKVVTGETYATPEYNCQAK